MEIKAYNALNSYQTGKSELESITAAAKRKVENTGKEDGQVGKSDRVSISGAAQTARFKALLGLDPTNKKLTKSELEGAAKKDRTAVNEFLKEFTEKAGLPEGTKLGLTADDKGKIHITGKVEHRAELEKALNSNDEFRDAFNRLSINERFLDFPNQINREIHAQQTTLLDYMGGGGPDLSQLINDFESAKTMNDPFSSMMMYTGNYTQPFTLDYEV